MMYLICLKAGQQTNQKYDLGSKNFKAHFGINYVRGCEIVEVIRDEADKDARTYRVKFDSNQYQNDLNMGVMSTVYGGFNILVRRKSKVCWGELILCGLLYKLVSS